MSARKIFTRPRKKRRAKFFVRTSRACKKSLFLRYYFDAGIFAASPRVLAKVFARVCVRSSSSAS
jgi:hypothetical protein